MVIEGRTLPTPSIVEDDDGARLLLIQDFHLPVELWLWAHAQGAAALVNTAAEKYVLTLEFTELRTENTMGGLVLAENLWHPWTPGMPWVQMLDDTPPEAAAGIPVDELNAALEEAAESLGGEFVHLHTHTEFSSLDGLTTMAELMAAVTADGQRAVAITDHGVCAGHAALQLAANKAGVKPIFGMEAYFVSDRHDRTEQSYWHLCLWAETDEGLRNLWALSTESFRTGFYYKPRIDWELLGQYSEGLIASTACLNGPVIKPYLDGDEQTARINLARLLEIFADRLYIELHVNHLDEQIRANEWLVPLSGEVGVPLLAVVDAHYDGHVCDEHDHRVWLAAQTKPELMDEGSGMFGGGQQYPLYTGAQVRELLGYLPDDVVDEAMANTVRVADRCKAEIRPKTSKPVFSRPTKEWPDAEAHDVERLWDLIESRWAERIPADIDQTEHLARVEYEMSLLVPKGYCGYYLMEQDLVMYAKNNGVLVGPGRGSGGGSLVAFIIGITELDPVIHGLLFERFMTPGRTALPDFDIDFPSSKKQMMFDYVVERWGAEHVCLIGTHVRLQSKGAVNDMFRVLQDRLSPNAFVDNKKVTEIIDEAEAGSAGLGVPWEELWVVEADRLDPYREKYPEVFDLADRMYHRLKSYGKHPAGVVIDPDESLTDNLPLRSSGDEHDGPMVCQFDMEVLEELGYVKFDLLNLRTLDTLQETLELIQGRTGEWIDIYGWRYDEQYADPIVYDEISAGRTLGIFQIETKSGTRMCTQFQPQNVTELADVITLVRPGPMRSGLTAQYQRRRAGEEDVEVPDPRLEPVLAKTYGCMVYQEDIMQTTMVLAGYDGTEADEVRKILGKKKVEKAVAAGQQFVARAEANGTDPEVARLLWEQMAEFAKYSFNRAHAFAYAVLGVWTAWLKIHYPIEFLTAALSTVKADRIPEFVEEARRLGYAVLPPDINESGPGFTAGQMSVRYGLQAVKGVGQVATTEIMRARADGPFLSYEDFLERRAKDKCNAGVVKVLARIGAFDSVVPHRRGLLTRIEFDEITGSDRCAWKEDEPVLITGVPIRKRVDGEMTETENTAMLPCSFDWPAEPREPSKQVGRYKQAKPLPKKCSRACRMYTPIPLPEYDEITPFTDEDIRRIELEVLEVFLSTTPFDRIPPDVRADCSTAEEILAAGPGRYITAALIRRFKPHTDRNGRHMGFLTLATENGTLDVTVFGDAREKYEASLTSGRLIFAEVRRDSGGTVLDDLVDLDEE